MENFFVEHTYFLLPLVFESTMPPSAKFVAGTVIVNVKS